MDKQWSSKQTRQDNPELRELTAVELDQVAGGLQAGPGPGEHPHPLPPSQAIFPLSRTWG
jgi:hypothetical protein